MTPPPKEGEKMETERSVEETPNEIANRVYAIGHRHKISDVIDAIADAIQSERTAKEKLEAELEKLIKASKPIARWWELAMWANELDAVSINKIKKLYDVLREIKNGRA